MIFQPSLTRKQLDKEFSKLRKLKYNVFRWWRLYDSPIKPLDARQPLRDRILNGDFEFSHYYFQAMWCEHEINDIHDQYSDDPGRAIELTTLTRQRRKRLLEDFEREEYDRLKELKSSLWANFKISKEELENVMESFDGSTIELYYYLDDKYKIINQLPPTLKRRGRPRKNG